MRQTSYVMTQQNIHSSKPHVCGKPIHSIFLRAIIWQFNSSRILIEEKRELESIALVIQTAQRYGRDVYFI